MGQKIMNFCGLWGAAGIVQLRGESSQPLVLPQCLAGPSGLDEAGSEVGCRHWPKTQLTTKTTARRSHPGNSAEDQGCAAGNPALPGQVPAAFCSLQTWSLSSPLGTDFSVICYFSFAEPSEWRMQAELFAPGLFESAPVWG